MVAATATSPSNARLIQAGTDQVRAICQSIAAVGRPRRIRTSPSPCRVRTADRAGKGGAESCIPVQRPVVANLSPRSFASLRPSPPTGREPMTRRLEPDDLYAIKLVEDPQITSDGERVAYVVVEIDRSSYEYHRSIWVAPTATGTPRQYTAGDNDTTPRWSPDGRSLVFVRAPAIPPGRRTATSSSTRLRSVSRTIPRRRTPACTRSACPPSAESIAYGLAWTARAGSTNGARISSEFAPTVASPSN